jgi:hypothetical protein
MPFLGGGLTSQSSGRASSISFIFDGSCAPLISALDCYRWCVMKKAKSKGRKRSNSLPKPVKDVPVTIETVTNSSPVDISPIVNPVTYPKSELKTFPFALSFSWRLLAAISVLMTIIGTVYAFSPRLSVSSSSPLDPSAPFSTPFTISNDGYISVHNVGFKCSIRKIALAYDQGRVPSIIGDYEPYGPRLVGPIASTIAPEEKFTAFCPWPFSNNTTVDEADIAVVVEFRQGLLPWHQEKRYRFKTVKDPGGKLHWLPQPVKE